VDLLQVDSSYYLQYPVEPVRDPALLVLASAGF